MVFKINRANDIKWDAMNPSLTVDDIYIFTKIPFILPTQFVELLMISDGGDVDYDFDYYDVDLEFIVGTGVPCIYGVMHGENDNLIYRYNNPPEFFPHGLLAFSETGNGDLICFDYRANPKTDNPPIVYWNHEAQEGRDVSFVAKDFEEFLSILKEPEDLY